MAARIGFADPNGANASPQERIALSNLAKARSYRIVTHPGEYPDPATNEGMMVYDLSDGLVYLSDGSAWNEFGETAASILTKIKTVDGTGSGLDADLLDGQEGSYYLARANHTGTQAVSTLTGTLPVANGGTGATTHTSGNFLKGAGTSAITSQSGINISDINGIYGRWRWNSASGTQTVSTGTVVNVQFDTEDEDVNIGLTPTFSSWTVGTTGTYSMYFGVRWTATGTRGIRIHVVRGGGLQDLIEWDYDPVIPAAGWTGGNNHAVSSTLRLTSGWTVYFQVYQATGGTRYIDEAFLSITRHPG